MERANKLGSKADVKEDAFAAYPELLRVEHVSEILGLSKQTVRCLLQSKELPGKHCGRRWYVPKRALVAYLFDTESA